MAGTLIMLFLGMLYAWSIFVKPFTEIFPSWSISDLSVTFSISASVFYFGGIVSGRLSSKLKNNIIVILGASLLFCGFFFISRLNPEQPVQSLRKLNLFYGVLCGLGTGMCYNAILSTIIKWFPDKPGSASGFLLMNYGMGGLILGMVINVLLVKAGLFDTFLILACAAAILLSIGSFFIKLPPETFRASAPASGPGENNFSSRQMLKTPSYWFWYIWMIMIIMSGYFILNSAAVIASSFGAPAVLGLLVSVANGCGRLFFGALMDRFGRSKIMLTSSTTLLAAGICLYTGGVLYNVILIFAGMLMVVLCFGSCPSMTSVFINSQFGSKNYQQNISIMNVMLIPAAVTGPIVSSTLVKRANGVYNSSFLLIIALALVSFIFIALLNRKGQTR